jgi:hypothetical protein
VQHEAKVQATKFVCQTQKVKLQKRQRASLPSDSIEFVIDSASQLPPRRELRNFSLTGNRVD